MQKFHFFIQLLPKIQINHLFILVIETFAGLTNQKDLDKIISLISGLVELSQTNYPKQFLSFSRSLYDNNIPIIPFPLWIKGSILAILGSF
jgi:hypothetical protein